jgi:hypothetical protein
VTWLKLDADFPKGDVWRREPDRSLWVWLQCMAKRNDPQGEVRFSYRTASEALAADYGNRRIVFSRKHLRKALQRLVRGGHVVVTDRAQRAAQGRAQGYFTVTICNWGAYQGQPSGKGTAAGTATDRHRARGGHEVGTPSRDRDREGEIESPSDSLVESRGDSTRESGARFVRLWNEATRGRNVRAIRSPPAAGSHRARLIGDFVRACGGNWQLVEAAVRAKTGEDWVGRREDPLDVDWFLRPVHREKHVEAGQDLLDGRGAGPGDTPEHRASAAKALGCDPQDLEWTGGTYRRRA